jgi:hypothetical protein
LQSVVSLAKSLNGGIDKPTAAMRGNVFVAVCLKNSLLLWVSFSIVLFFLVACGSKGMLFNGKQSGASQTYPYFFLLGLDSHELSK